VGLKPYSINHEVHDAELLPNGNVAIADMGRERVFVVNRETKQITWTWNASSYYQPPEEGVRYTDWLHINDVDYLGDGQFMVSVRNANQILIVERGTGVVEVINEDRSDANDGVCRGPQDRQMTVPDPTCGSPELMDHQHNPQWLGDGHVLVADSENDRVIELVHEDGEWEIGWTDHGANGIRYDWPRDADRLPNGNTLITDTRNARLVEVNEAGDVVWAAKAPQNVYEADRGREYEANLSVYTTSGDSAPMNQPIRLVALIHGGVQETVALPDWFGEWQFLGLLVGVVGSWVGMVLWIVPRASDAVDRMVPQSSRELTTDD